MDKGHTMVEQVGFDPVLDGLLDKNSKSITEQYIESENQLDDAKKRAMAEALLQGKKEDRPIDAPKEEPKPAEAAEVIPATAVITEKEVKETKPLVNNDWLFQEKPNEAVPVQDTTDYKAIKALLDSDEELKLIIEAKKAGKSVFEIVNEVQGPDATKMSVEDLIRWDGKKENLTDTDIQKEIENYQSMRDESPLRARKFENELRSARADEQKQLLRKYTGNVVSTSREASQKQTESLNKLYAEVAAAKKEMIGKGFFGLTLDENDADDFEKYVKNEFTFQKADGSYDTNKLRLFYLAEKKLKRIHEVNLEDGKAAGVSEVLKEVSRPNLNDDLNGKLPTPKPVTEAKEIAKGAQDLVRSAYGINSKP